MTKNLTAHFTLGELEGESAPADVQINLYKVAQLLESVREILGVPIRVTSGYRAPAHNAEIGGAKTSQHMDGTAADISPVGLSLQQVQDKLAEAEIQGRLAPYGQLIFYPYTTGHVHISLPTRGKSGERLVKLGPEQGDGYERLGALTFRSEQQCGSSATNSRIKSCACGCKCVGCCLVCG